MSLDKSYSPDFSQGSTYTSENPIPIDPENIGVTDSSPDFVVPSVGGGGTSITDYVPASTGGQFAGKIYYPSALSLTGNYDIVYKSWVEDYVANNVCIDFNTLFDARFATSSLASLNIKDHSNLTGILGDGSYHLNEAQKNNIVSPASSIQNGYLSYTDWRTFNSKLSSLSTGSGLNYNAGTISLVLDEIDHNSLLNYETDRHLLRDDNATDSNSLWSADKIATYVASQIPAVITDYVSKANGGNFDAVIGYSTTITPTLDTDITPKKYTDDTITSSITTYNSTLLGGGVGSILEYLGTIDITSIGTRNHNDLQTFQGGTTGEEYHLTQDEHTLATQYSSSTQGGLLSLTDWNTFNGKLSAFSTQESSTYNEFLHYDTNVLYYNPAYLDHNTLLNYDVDRHALLDDTTTTTSNVWSASYISNLLSTSTVRPYSIRLNSGATVAQRLVGLLAGTDYPTGWTLSADEAALVITHSLDKRSKVVKVLSKNGTTSNCVELQGNVAYSTKTDIYGTGYNAIRLDAFATVTTELYVEIIL